MRKRKNINRSWIKQPQYIERNKDQNYNELLLEAMQVESNAVASLKY